VEDTAASHRAAPKRLAGRAAKLLTWEEQDGDITAAVTPRPIATASAPARKRQRTAEAPPRSASAPSRRARGTPTVPMSPVDHDGAGTVSDSEGGPAISAAKRRRANGSRQGAPLDGKQVSLLSGPPRPAAITFAGADELPARRFRSISAIYKAVDTEDCGTAERPARVSSTAVKRTRATPRPGRTPQHSVHAEAQQMADAADTDVRAPQSDNAEQPPRQTPVARITRAAASRPHSSQLVTAEVDAANVLPQAKLPDSMAAAVAASTRSHDGAARTDNGAAAVNSAARGPRWRTAQRKPSEQPRPTRPAVGAQDVSADGDASSDEEQLEARQIAAKGQLQAEASREAATAIEAAAEKLGESAGPSEISDASASHAAAAEEEEASDADDSADDSDAFLQTLAARMLATAADAQGSDLEGSDAEDESEHGRIGLPEQHSGSAAEHGSDSEDEFGERCRHSMSWRPHSGRRCQHNQPQFSLYERSFWCRFWSV